GEEWAPTSSRLPGLTTARPFPAQLKGFPRPPRLPGVLPWSVSLPKRPRTAPPETHPRPLTRRLATGQRPDPVSQWRGTLRRCCVPVSVGERHPRHNDAPWHPGHVTAHAGRKPYPRCPLRRVSHRANAPATWPCDSGGRGKAPPRDNP